MNTIVSGSISMAVKFVVFSLSISCVANLSTGVGSCDRCAHLFVFYCILGLARVNQCLSFDTLWTLTAYVVYNHRVVYRVEYFTGCSTLQSGVL